MIVRNLEELKSTERSVSDAEWTSVRLLLANDQMGFSFHITTIKSNTEHTFHYKHHFESVYCISGKGAVVDLKTNERHEISPGVMYALDQHDKHKLICEEEMTLACCFNPALTGLETHQEDGSYPPPESPSPLSSVG